MSFDSLLRIQDLTLLPNLHLCYTVVWGLGHFGSLYEGGKGVDVGGSTDISIDIYTLYMLWVNFVLGLNFIFLCFWVW